LGGGKAFAGKKAGLIVVAERGVCKRRPLWSRKLIFRFDLTRGDIFAELSGYIEGASKASRSV
jgi:hypothetical protein